MIRVLHIDGSPRGDRSKSRPVAKSFLAGGGDAFCVNRCDVWNIDLPPMDGSMIEGRYDMIMGNAPDADLEAQWAAVAKVAENFLNHDLFLISTPMWNFGLPYKLKHYIDVVTQPGMTFRNDAQGNVEGFASGKTAMIIAASAMPIGNDATLANLDFQQRYLECWLGFIGITDIDVLRIAPTYGDVDEVDAIVVQAQRDAEDQAAEIAKRLSQPRCAYRPD